MEAGDALFRTALAALAVVLLVASTAAAVPEADPGPAPTPRGHCDQVQVLTAEAEVCWTLYGAGSARVAFGAAEAEVEAWRSGLQPSFRTTGSLADLPATPSDEASSTSLLVRCFSFDGDAVCDVTRTTGSVDLAGDALAGDLQVACEGGGPPDCTDEIGAGIAASSPGTGIEQAASVAYTSAGAVELCTEGGVHLGCADLP